MFYMATRDIFHLKNCIGHENDYYSSEFKTNVASIRVKLFIGSQTRLEFSQIRTILVTEIFFEVEITPGVIWAISYDSYLMIETFY